MAKNIVICCDGTGNEFGDHNSNVVKLYSTLIIDHTNQVGYYHPGVGTMGSPTATNKLSKAWSVLKGLAFGAGLLTNAGDAYRYLMNVYETGDRVFLFGFSRGAYTVRVLAGVLHMFGLLCPGNEGLIPYITRLFAKRTRRAGGMTHTFQVAQGFKDTFCRPCPLHFVGVWDTVSSVGWIFNPVQVPYTGRNPDMLVGRHAVSIDERRCYFRNNLWGHPFPHQDIKQVWFSGVHSDVGGSYPESQSGLSKIALEWMLHEAFPFGLLIDPQRADRILGTIPTPPPAAQPAAASQPVAAANGDKNSLPPPVAPNPAAPEHNSLTLPWWLLEFLPHSYFDPVKQKPRWRIPLGASRKIPEGSVLHSTVHQKLTADPKYRPGNLPKEFTVEPQDSSSFTTKGIAATGRG